MKNLILTLAIVFSVIACKKQEFTNEADLGTEMAIADSLPEKNSAVLESVQKNSIPKRDSALPVVKDTAIVIIKELKEEKKLLTEKVARTMDSATKSTIISEIKIAQQKIDSVKNKLAVLPKKRTQLPKTVRETKIIYRENPAPKVSESLPAITRTGAVEITVDDVKRAQITTKELIFKYDGSVKSEEISSYNSNEYAYLKITLPSEKTDYLLQDLEENAGAITARNIKITESGSDKRALSQLEITLVKNSQNAAGAVSASFGGKTLGAFVSGWNVIAEIFLFILPLWPVFFIGGGIYYFIKKKKREQRN